MRRKEEIELLVINELFHASTLESSELEMVIREDLDRR